VSDDTGGDDTLNDVTLNDDAAAGTPVGDRVATIEQLERLFRPPGERALAKELSAIDAGIAAFIDRCPFLVLATANGAGSIDASPRGGPPGFVRRLDDHHIAIPDLNGNNRLDSYRNLIEHPWAGVLLIIPGKDETLRINGPAVLTTDPELLAGFTTELRTPKLALVVEAAEIYGHCAKAFRRGGVWDPATWAEVEDAPDLAAMYACTWNLDADRMRATLARVYAEDLAQD
jgi:PPOX class probable FMN-dependent enzyme